MSFNGLIILVNVPRVLLLLLLLLGELLPERCPWRCRRPADDLLPNVSRWPSSRQCELQISGAGCLHQLFWAKVFLDVQRVSSSQRVDGARWIWCGGDLPLGLYESGWPKNLRRRNLTTSETGVQAVTSRTVLFVVCLVYGIRRISVSTRYQIHQDAHL